MLKRFWRLLVRLLRRRPQPRRPQPRLPQPRLPQPRLPQPRLPQLDGWRLHLVRAGSGALFLVIERDGSAQVNLLTPAPAPLAWHYAARTN